MNWDGKEKEENVVDVSAPNFFWRAHTVTVLLGNHQFIRSQEAKLQADKHYAFGNC